MTLTGTERQLLNLLGEGRELTRSTTYLSQVMKLDRRTIRDIIKRLIVNHGVPIIGVRTGYKTGYYIASTTEELMDGTKTYYSQIREEQKRLDALMSVDLNSWKVLREEIER